MRTSISPQQATATAVLALILTACGGGGGDGDTPAAPAKTLASMSVNEVPAQWPDNLKTVTVNRAALASAEELSKTSNPANQIFIHIWYLDQDQQRQDVAHLTLATLDGMGGNLTFPNIPVGANSLHTEVYTAQNKEQQTLAKKEIAV